MFLKKTWWIPIQIQSAMSSQGIKGPSYKFLHGNTREITQMRRTIMNGPMELSHQIFPRIEPHVYSWIKLYGANFLNWYGFQAQLVVTEPELVLEVLNNKQGLFEKKIIQNYADKLFGDGLVRSVGKKWLKMRKLAHQAFHGESLKGMIPAIVASVDAMLERWRQNEVKEIEIFEEFQVLTSEIISRTAFGNSYLEGKNLLYMLTRMGTIVARNNFHVKIPVIKKFLKTCDDIESDELEQGMRDCIIKMMKTREEEVSAGKIDNYGSDFLGILLKAHHDRNLAKKISVQDIVDECKTFYLAGQETTASSITWIVFLLAIHPIWQDKVREEVIKLIGKQNPGSDSIGQFKIMSMIINESLRLYPPVFHITRETQKEGRLGNIIISEKMAVALPMLACHHSPHVWGEDVHSFKPERFADGKATKNNILGFIPFGSGSRSCVGSNLATTEIKITLSMILQRYKFTLSPTYVHAPVHHLTICPQFGVQIVLEAIR